MELLFLLAFFAGWIVGYIQEHYRTDKVNKLIKDLEAHKKDYLIYRGSSFNQITGELMWAKDDAEAYAEGMDSAIAMIKREFKND